ncbi:hypothetical protein, partial [Bradyrhizobium cenepequi]|uniref:hypothetical protein n=1 Tax=Bradyrhizobium cenepequi TaxID=2821403 RepID=UPI001CE2AEEE
TLTTYGVRPTIIKDHVETPADLAYDRWNSFSRITVSRSETVPPAMFGASPRLPHSTIEQRALNIDGGAGTALYRFDGDLAKLGFLRYDVTNLAYAIPDLKFWNGCPGLCRDGPVGPENKENFPRSDPFRLPLSRVVPSSSVAKW